MSVRCVDCGSESGRLLPYRCSECGGILDRIVDLERIDPAIFSDDPSSMWDYQSLFPVETPLSLGEGGTPLIRTGLRLSTGTGIDFHLKLEGENPTCSFKDRPSALGLAYVKERTDIETAVISSHGNAGASFTAYANRVGIDPIVLVPNDADEGLPKVRGYGAITVPVNGNISDTYSLANAARSEFGWYNGTTTHQVPTANQANRTLAYELFAQLGSAPDWVVIPISAGPLLTQTYRGFEELRALGLIDSVPSLVGSQASGCAPIADAYSRGSDTVEEWRDPLTTVATSIEDPLRGYPDDGTYTLSIIRESDGAAVAIDDDSIRSACDQLRHEEGILAEYASASVLPAIDQLRENGSIGDGETVVGVITGHGMNELGKIASHTELRDPIDPTLSDLATVVDD